VKAKVTQGKSLRGTAVSEIVLNQGLAEALEGLGDFSHLYVIFWMHRIPDEKRRTMKTHPRGRTDMPLLGIFATRTPHRPNPLGLTIVRLLSTHENVLTVQGLDAFDGTPVLDIKPYDFWDKKEATTVPEWWMKLEKERQLQKQTSSSA